MLLPLAKPEHAEEFRRLYVEHRGVELTPEEARDRFQHLLQFYFLTDGITVYENGERLRAEGWFEEALAADLPEWSDGWAWGEGIG